MTRLFIANFDFEHRLAVPGTLPRHLERISSELAPAWAAIADDGDGVWTPVAIDPGIFETLTARGLPRLVPVASPELLPRETQLVFWGENDWARTTAGQWGFRWTGCEPSVVRTVNSRRFKFALERRLNVDLPGASLLSDRDDLAAAGERFSSSNWVLKGEFGGAGREVRFGSGLFSSADAGWVGNRFRRGLSVTIEPRLDCIAEAGMQFQIDSDGAVAFIGVTLLLSRADGSYEGSRFEDDASLPADWSEAVAVGRLAAQAVARERYCGPLGIDAMRYRDAAGETRFRPLQDLNARYTMGRLALGLRRFPRFAASANHLFRIDEFRATTTIETV